MDFNKNNVFFIQEEVSVQYDKAQQTPLGFQWLGRHYEVLQPIHLFINAQGHINYLLLTNRGTFCLSFVCENKDHVSSRGRWILKCRVDLGRLKNRSAIDALQLMTGCSIGNQNFFAYAWGRK